MSAAELHAFTIVFRSRSRSVFSLQALTVVSRSISKGPKVSLTLSKNLSWWRMARRLLKMLLSRPFFVAEKCLPFGSKVDENRKAGGDVFPKVATLNSLRMRMGVKSFSASCGEMVLYLVGGTSKILRCLLSTQEVSNMVLKAMIFPCKLHDLNALRYFAFPRKQSMLYIVERMLLAYNHALKFFGTGSPILGARFVSPWANRDHWEYRLMISIRIANQLRTFSAELLKGLRTREKEDKVLSHLLLQEIMKACMIGMTIDSSLTEFESETILVFEMYYNEDQQLMQVTNEETCYKIYPFSRGINFTFMLTSIDIV